MLLDEVFGAEAVGGGEEEGFEGFSLRLRVTSPSVVFLVEVRKWKRKKEKRAKRTIANPTPLLVNENKSRQSPWSFPIPRAVRREAMSFLTVCAARR